MTHQAYMAHIIHCDNMELKLEEENTSSILFRGPAWTKIWCKLWY